MHLYVRIILLWVILWGIPYLIAKVQWKLYKADNGGLNYKYWSRDNGWWITSHLFFMTGIIILSLTGFFVFLLWFFPELNNFGL
jgi:hypothetical protein|nr:MAG TPA: hypothetical protein [Crassvirales sp.]